MSQLQIGLISLGALIILAVLLYNWWQERSIRREMLRRFEGPLDDVLMERDRRHDNDFTLGSAVAPDEEALVRAEEDIIVEIESIIEPEPAPSRRYTPERHDGHVVSDEFAEPDFNEPDFNEPVIEEPAFDEPESVEASFIEERPTEARDLSEDVGAEFLDTAEPPDLEAAAEVIADELGTEPVWISNPADADAGPIDLPLAVDPLIDEIAIVKPNRPCTGAAIREALLPLPAFQQSVRWIGREAGGAYMVVTKEHEQTVFTHVVCALQLADRSGPAHGEDLRNFHVKVEDLTARLGAGLEWREHGDPLLYARQLDQFCIDVDVMISLQLAGGATGPFAGTKLRGVAEANGLTLQEDGRFHYLNEDGASQFVLVSQDKRPFTADLLRTTMFTGLVLMMDIPRAANGVEVFNLMVNLGRKLETALATRLMDENQQQLGEGEIDKIRQQLKFIYKKMLARGIMPGSPSALRLFS